MKNFVFWSKILIILGCNSVVRVQNVGESTVRTIQHCGRSFPIKCATDEMINVISANYGRTNTNICQDGTKTNSCVLDSSILVVRSLCQGQSKCTISTSDFTTDPCPDVSKYIEVNYTCEPKASASCSSANTCDEKTEVCVDKKGGIVCECAENYQRGNDRNCQAMTCANSPTVCNAINERCEDMHPGIQCVCAEGYTNDNNECIAMTCENSATSCNATTQRCEDVNPGIQCVCAEGYMEDRNKQCIAVTCENTETTCNAVSERCEDLIPGIQCVCAEGYAKDNNNQCTAVTCESSSRPCNAVTQLCKDLNPGIQCVCAEGYMEDNNNQCVAMTCENSATLCNAVTQRCVDSNPGIHCVCREGYTQDSKNECIAMTCENTNTTCSPVTQRCEDLNPGIRCVCAEEYVVENHTNQCVARTCENSVTTCNAVTQRCENLNPGFQCVCAEGYTEDNDGKCIAVTCYNAGTTCDAVTQRCEDLHPGVQCVCAENYMEDNSSQCIAVTCENAGTTCDADTQRCKDLHPGIQCVCAEHYMEDKSSKCIVVTCENAGTTCDAVTQRCKDLHPGVQCVCAENYMEDNSSQCIAVTCANTDRACTPVSERCEDLNPGVRCVCAEGYMEDINNKCIEIRGAHSTTEVPENGTRCPADTINIGVILISFPSAETGEEVNSSESCSNLLSQNQRQPLATRVCNQVWQEPKLQNCFDIDTPEKQLDVFQLNLTNSNVREVSSSFALYTYQLDNITARLLELIIEYLSKIVAVGSASFEVTDVVVSTVSVIMTVNEEILDETRGVSLVIPLMEKQVTNVLRNGQNYSQSLQNVGVSTLTMQKSAFEYDFTFIDRVTALTENTRGEKMVEETSITIPSSVLALIDKVYPNTTEVPISFVTYEDSRLFRKDKSKASENRNGTQEYIGSYVVSSTVELPNVTIDGLPQNSSVIIKFSDLMLKERDKANKTELLCVYWKYTSDDGQGEWSQAGCKKLSSGFENVTCSCDHLTSFAVLVRIHGEDNNEETTVHLVLQLITIIGCIISTIGLFLSLMCMIIIRKVRLKQQTRVHFNLCLALIGLYLSFLFGIDKADKPSVCRLMTSVIYFFCLSSMAWMSVEAFYIYKLIWKCKRNNIKHLISVGALFGWGLPGIAAIIIYSLDNTHDYETEPDYCFLHPGQVLYYGFLLELLLLFLYNSVIFILVTYRLISRKIEVWNREYKRRERIIRFKSTVLFWLLLGISWIFGFLATFAHPADIVFQIMFCVLLSLQGFFMFYMLILQNPEMKKSLSTVSSLRTPSISLQLGARASLNISSKEQKIKGGFASFSQGNNESFV
ncbi:Adhesion G-protein coupled receptor G4 [Holothuria leucospilota]|uniref:Adhesion G-protein coupled receptor G4 n=1 Tax=Holothuria leucospilota TaxID=206669 RepID=A0A9Q1CCW9_HOLLE|nr:Adhesion G-protein coupled receptor G4 [Holothuria leucospilota]